MPPNKIFTPPSDNNPYPCPVMDLSAEVSAALRLLGDASKTEQAKYQEVLQKVTEDVTKDTPASTSVPQLGGEDDGKHYSNTTNSNIVYCCLVYWKPQDFIHILVDLVAQLLINYTPLPNFLLSQPFLIRLKFTDWESILWLNCVKNNEMVLCPWPKCTTLDRPSSNCSVG